MASFLLVYDWACGQLVSLEPYPSDAEAEAAAAIVAAMHEDDDSVEISIVHADSEQSLRLAHRRYFDAG